MNKYESILSKFKSKMRSEEKSERTTICYMTEAKRFVAFAEEHGYDSLVEASIAYKQTLIGKLQATTINKKIAAVNAFLASADESFELKSEKLQPSNIYNVLTEKEYERICKKLEEFEEYQLLAIIRTLAGTGIRFSELESVTVEACRKKQLTIRGRGNKTRKVVLMKELASYLLEYAESKQIRNGMIFATRNGSIISLPQFHRKLKGCIGKMRGGLAKEKVHAHAFRHFFALQVLQKTGNISQVQALLGHSNPATTMIYLRTSEAELKDAVESISNEIMSGMKKKHYKKEEKK